MKPRKILLFIVLVISLLTVISILFPADGITIGKVTLKFPKPEEILVRQSEDYQDPEEILKQWQLQQMDSLKNELMDTLSFYCQAMASPTKIYFPNDDYTYFDDLFTTLLSAKENQRTVRILHYGDSQIELDRISVNLRSFFQSNFGGGGPGMLPLFQSVATPTVYQSFSGNYTQYALYGDGSRNSKKDYGVMAKSFLISGNNLFSVSSPRNKDKTAARDSYSSVKVFCTPADTNFTVQLSSKSSKQKVSVKAHSKNAQLIACKLDTTTFSMNVNFSGQASIYGILVDNGYGVAVDNIAMRGSGGTFFTQMDDSLLTSYYKMLDVGMIILQYGGNAVPSLYNETSIDSYVKRIGDQIRFIKRVAPHTPILFIGPSDMSTRINGTLTTYKYLPTLIDKLKECVLSNGAAFWNLYEVMGGKNSMLAWVKKGWAGKDYVHFTPQGAHNIGEVLTQSLSIMYHFYDLRQHNPSIHFDDVWNKLIQQYSDSTKKGEALPPQPTTNKEHEYNHSRTVDTHKVVKQPLKTDTNTSDTEEEIQAADPASEDTTNPINAD